MTSAKDLHQRVSALSPNQRAALMRQLMAKVGQAVPGRLSNSPQRLVAYVVPAQTTYGIDPAALGKFLKAKLPAQMMPAAIVPLKDLPRTANGKIDIKALPPPPPLPPSPKAAAPQTPAEESLVQIWQEVLGRAGVGIHDNFFELGGDSILSIQVVSRAREAGLRLAPNQLFEYPTVAELARVVNVAPEVSATQDAVTGAVPLTPIQCWFFDQGMVAPHHWHQALLLELPPGVTALATQRAIATLWSHHDALRLRFSQDSKGWHACNADASNPPSLGQIDLSHLSEPEQREALAQHGSDLHAGLDLASDPLIQAAYFNRGADRSHWLLISLHHLVVDAVSWQILDRDLSTLLNQPDQPGQLPAKTTAFKVWAETLAAQARTQQGELVFWCRQLEQPAILLPRDYETNLPSTEKTAHTIHVTLDVADTHSLLQAVPAAYNTQINDVLLTALAQTLLQWADADGGSVRIEVEAHGREQIVPEIDLSLTVGWFTATYPITLQLSNPHDQGASLKSIKEQLRQIPARGIGYGMLRYLTDEATQRRLAQVHPPDVLFNYLGQREIEKPSSDPPGVTNAGIRAVSDADVGVLRNPNNRRSYLLEINTWVGHGQLRLNWTFDTQIYAEDTIVRVANGYLSTLKRLINHCRSADSGGYTPSDFPDAALSQAELDALIHTLTPIQPGAQAKFIEAIYPLAPLQQAFLWHGLQASSQAGLLHMRGTLHGELNPTLLQQAWEFVLSRHPTLRTAIYWEAVPQPLQVVMGQVKLPWVVLDFREREDPRQALADFLAADRARGLDFTQAPIMRLTLIRLGATQHELVWTCHHLMLDGWSGALVINQVLDTYEALFQGHPLIAAPAPTYQANIRWLQQQDEAAAAKFWRHYLKGFTAPTPLPVQPGAAVAAPSASVRLSSAETAALQQFLRSHRLTLNSLIQGIWALLLYRHSGQTEVLFGATVSGRQADLPGVEAIVGLLINVLPVRVSIAAETPLLDWLQTLQTDQALVSRYAHASPVQIQTWSECTSRLFNSLLVVENYPAQPTEVRSLRLENLRSGIISTYGLTIVVQPGAALALHARAQSAHSESLDALLQEFKTVITAVIANPGSPIYDFIPAPTVTAPVTGKLPAAPKYHQPSAGAHVAVPRNPLELKVAKIWGGVLGVPTLSAEANFFDLGGDSLLAVQIFNQMQQQLGCTLPLATLFQAPTVRAFAALLSQQQPPSPWSSLVPIQPGGSRRPFFFHGGSADALAWAKFAQRLGPDQPFYALQRPDLDGRPITDNTVEALAAKCIEEIRTVQADGPYVIGGHCFGGAVAFEIAQQLQAQGEAIASLILVDAYCPNALPDTPLGRLQERLQLIVFWLRKTYYYYGNWAKLVKLPDWVWRRIRPTKPNRAAQATPSVAQNLSQFTPVPINPTTANTTALGSLAHAPYEERYAFAHRANIRAAERYWPQPYGGRIHLFRADVQILDWRYGSEMGWQIVAKDGLEIVTIPGLFGKLFNQQAGPLLAAQLNAYLSTLE